MFLMSEAPLYCAVSKGQEALVRLLVDKGDLIYRRSSRGSTPHSPRSSDNLAGNFQSTLAFNREVIRFSKFIEDRKLRDARGL